MPGGQSWCALLFVRGCHFSLIAKGSVGPTGPRSPFATINVPPGLWHPLALEGRLLVAMVDGVGEGDEGAHRVVE